jgi:hypothetical protein
MVKSLRAPWTLSRSYREDNADLEKVLSLRELLQGLEGPSLEECISDFISDLWARVPAVSLTDLLIFEYRAILEL